jgi:uncharacterized membrane protein YfhO
MSKFSKFKPKNPLPAIKTFFAAKEHIWLSFLIPFAVMAGAYIYFGVYPFGERSVLSLDLNAQYVFYFQYMKDALFGSESILYSWSRNLSGEFVGIIGYYLFSPFNLIVWAFPLSHITEGLLLMILFKIGFIGVTMSVYLSVCRGFAKHTTIMFSSMYALLSYNIVQTMNPMWLDGVMALPLVVMGIESLLKQGKYKLLTFSLFYSFVTCFYIGYMIAIFAALYFVYYALTSRKLTVKGNVTLLLKRAGLFASVAVVATLLSAFILLPVYSALSMGKFEFSNPDYSIRSSFTILEMTRKLFPNSYDTVRPEGMPFIYAGTLALILLPAYFFCDRIRRVRRFGGILFIAILVYSMVITPLDMFWHGGQVPNWLPYRYSFMLCFLMLAFSAEAFEHIRKIPRKILGGSAVFFAALLIYWENADTFMEELGSGRDVFNWFATAMTALIALTIFASILILGRDRLNKHNMITAALVALVALELFYNVQNSIDNQNTDIVYSTRKSLNEMTVPTREVTDRINKQMEANGEFYRMEKTFIRSACDTMALRMRGVTHSSSMLNDRAIALLRNMGYAARSHMSRYSGATALTDDLFGFKYILSSREDRVSSILSADDITVNVNEDVMPIAYLVSPKMLDFTFECERFQDDVFTNQSKMLSYMLGDELNEYFVRMEPVERRPQNLIEEGMGDGYTGYSRGDEPIDAHIEYDIVADADGDYYMYFPSRYERRCNLWVNNQFLRQVYETDNHHIQHLGYFTQGEEFMMTLSLTQDKVFFRDEKIVRLDKELLEADIARLHAMNENTVFEAVNNRRLRITANHGDEMLLFTSIPAEPGWKATLNGKSVDIMEIVGVKPEGEDVDVGSLMAIMVPPGNNVIELKFFPQYMRLGIILFFVGVGGFVLLCFVMTKFERNRRILEGGAIAADDYDGFDSDYVNLDSMEYEDFDKFDKAYEQEAQESQEFQELQEPSELQGPDEE